MEVVRYQYAADFSLGPPLRGVSINSGTFDSTYLDTTVYVSQYNHPSVAANTTIDPADTTTDTGGVILANTGHFTATLNGGNIWTGIDIYAQTTKALDSLTFTTTARQVFIDMAGLLSSGEEGGPHTGASGLTANVIRNGAIVNLLVDSVLRATIDTYNNNPRTTLFLDGNSHDITIQHSGSYNTAVAPIQNIVNTVGTSVGSALSLIPASMPSFIQASWRILATSASVYSLYRTLPGGSETLIIAGLTVGTTYSATYIPGVILLLTEAIVINNAATFITDPVMCTIAAVSLGFGFGSGTSQYTSPIIDAGANDNLWFLAEWTQNAPLPAFQAHTGNTLPIDASWETTTLTPTSFTLPVSQETVGLVGLSTVPRSQYLQWTISFPAVGTVTPSFRDLWLYYWVPERDPVILSKLGVASQWIPGPNMIGYAGTLAVTAAKTEVLAQDLINSYTISGAVDQYLASYGVDLDIPQYTAEPPNSYRTRIVTAFQSGSTGGSIPFIKQQLSFLIFGYSNATTWAQIVITNPSKFKYNIILPPAQATPTGTFYLGLPGLPVAQARPIISTYITTVLTPVTNIANSITFL